MAENSIHWNRFDFSEWGNRRPFRNGSMIWVHDEKKRRNPNWGEASRTRSHSSYRVREEGRPFGIEEVGVRHIRYP